ncbi:methyl-CpG-binding domain-containing protein 5-like protein [Cinnamomum micranthum f. kanehirae]|uniref:Methyl-CpG-binding domain-containing protein 5-like protein n=1 Tax=Cinnamomum micranthum f. kanehirae TaxID=337451 RepID=A0A3S3R1Z9_9MAGN|nr:methyl-CpG-binding domain-containing protein 5-like protein [Cinnamomum micranthum f. kanehirae]
MGSGEGDGGLEQSIVLGEGLEAPDRNGESETMPERLESLFKDWAMEVCIRNSRKIVGYYYDLKSHHHFRSKKDVEYFLLTGMIRRYTPKSKKSATNKPQQSELMVDFKNHPTKVSWVLTNFLEGMWTSCKEGCRSRHGIHGWPQ